MSVTLSRTPLVHPADLCRTCRHRLSRQIAPSSSPSSIIARPSARFETTQAASRQRTKEVGNVSGSFENDLSQSQPRWARAPSAMRAPIGFRRQNANDDFEVNEDPEKLNNAIGSFVGRDGYAIIPEEVRWLAVTHKSFDHGRRGFNERLAYYGNSIITLQLALRLLSAPKSKPLHGDEVAEDMDNYGRVPFQHPALDGLDNVSRMKMYRFMNPKRIAGLAQTHGLQDVVRWKPREIRKLQASGLNGVLVETIGAIIGAVALHNGADAANRITRERLLNPLGVP